jgi:probable HAF family extracellular repeat protein
MVDLGTLGGPQSAAWSVNNSGEVALTTDLAQTQEVRGLCQEADVSGPQVCRAVFRGTGGLKDLGTLGGANSVAFGINDHHEVVGVADTTNSLRAFIWSKGVLKNLGTPRGIDSGGHAINNRGQVAIDAHISLVNNPKLGEPDYHAFLWDRGRFTDLGTLGGSASFAMGMNDKGEVVGYASLAGDDIFDAFLWANGVMMDLGVLPTDFAAVASGVNDREEVVGTSFGAIPRAFLWTQAHIIDLNTLISPSSGWQLVLAQAINKRGEIVGEGVHNGQARAFLLTPTEQE